VFTYSSTGVVTVDSASTLVDAFRTGEEESGVGSALLVDVDPVILELDFDFAAETTTGCSSVNLGCSNFGG